MSLRRLVFELDFSGNFTSADLPTPTTCKSGGFKKQAQRNLEIRTSNKNNNDRLFVAEYSLPN